VRRTLGRVGSPRHLGRPLLRRKRDYGRGDPRPGRPTRLHCRSRPRRRRNFAEPAGEVPGDDVFKYFEFASGCSRKASRASRGTSRSTSKNLRGRPTMPRLPTSSAGMHLASPGGRSPAGTSWRRMTGRCTRNWNDSWPSGWVQPHTKSIAATFRCYPTPPSLSTLRFLRCCLIVFSMLSGADRTF
jgi:hypothetical protein